MDNIIIIDPFLKSAYDLFEVTQSQCTHTIYNDHTYYIIGIEESPKCIIWNKKCVALDV
jgi:hypothetical protein